MLYDSISKPNLLNRHPDILLLSLRTTIVIIVCYVPLDSTACFLWKRHIFSSEIPTSINSWRCKYVLHILTNFIRMETNLPTCSDWLVKFTYMNTVSNVAALNVWALSRYQLMLALCSCLCLIYHVFPFLKKNVRRQATHSKNSEQILDNQLCAASLQLLSRCIQLIGFWKYTTAGHRRSQVGQ